MLFAREEGRTVTETQYDPHEQDRLWQHTLHEDLLLAERANFFLVAESLFVVAYAELLPSGSEDLAAAGLAAAGLLLTAAWFVLNRRHFQVVADVERRARDSLREYRDSFESKKRNVPGLITARPVLVWFVPGLLFVTWLFLFVAAVS
jgi:hypothetical protein